MPDLLQPEGERVGLGARVELELADDETLQLDDVVAARLDEFWRVA